MRVLVLAGEREGSLRGGGVPQGVVGVGALAASAGEDAGAVGAVGRVPETITKSTVKQYGIPPPSRTWRYSAIAVTP